MWFLNGKQPLKSKNVMWNKKSAENNNAKKIHAALYVSVTR